MKRLLYLTIFLTLGIWFCSCGSHRSNLKQETSIESGSNHQRKDTASASEQVKKTEYEDVTETVEEVTTVYDTSQPADSSTGRPPVLSETKKTTRKESKKRSQEDKDTNLNQSTSLSSQGRMAIEATEEEDKQKEETTIPRQIGWIVWGLVVLVGVGRIGWLVYRRKKR